MKYRILMVLIAGLSVLTSYAQNKSYMIEARIKGLADGTNFFLRKNSANGGTDTIHKIVLNKGKFTIKGTVDEPELHFLFIEGDRKYLSLLLENERYSITGDISAWPKLDVRGPEQHEEFEQMKGVLNKDLDEAKQLTGREKEKVLTRYYEETVPLVVKQHPNSLYTPVLINKHLKRDFKDISPSEKRDLYMQLTDYAKSGKYGKELLKTIDVEERREKIREGTIIPDFKMIGLNGQQFSIRQVAALSKYTLIDFWASWCKPCRAQVPHLKEVYEKYKDRGFNILAISSDKQEIDWRNAIKEDSTSWVHGLQIEGNANRLFGINAIPGYVLIDQQGKFIAYSVTSAIPLFGPNIKGKDLDKVLDELFK